MTTYTFAELFSSRTLAASFNPSLDVIDLGVPANRVVIKRLDTGTAFVVDGKEVILPMDVQQIVSGSGASDNVRVESTGDSRMDRAGETQNGIMGRVPVQRTVQFKN